jgi:hypothetical protein
MRGRLARLELAWLIGCVLLWLAVSGGTGTSPAECYYEGKILCPSVELMLIIVGIFMAVVWVVGALLIGVIYAVVVRTMRRRQLKRDQVWHREPHRN